MPKMVLEMIKTSNLKSGWQILVEEFIFLLHTTADPGIIVRRFAGFEISTYAGIYVHH